MVNYLTPRSRSVPSVTNHNMRMASLHSTIRSPQAQDALCLPRDIGGDHIRQILEKDNRSFANPQGVVSPGKIVSDPMEMIYTDQPEIIETSDCLTHFRQSAQGPHQPTQGLAEELKRLQIENEKLINDNTNLKIALSDKQTSEGKMTLTRRYTDFPRKLQPKGEGMGMGKNGTRHEPEIRRLMGIIDDQKTRVLKAQEAAKRMMEESKLCAMSDSDIKDWFTNRERDWYNWAKENAHREDPRLPEEARRELAEFVDFHNAEPLLTNKGAAYILLQGLLSNFICRVAFVSPWWIFDALQGFSPEAQEAGAIASKLKDDDGVAFDGGIEKQYLRRNDHSSTGKLAHASMKHHMEVLYDLLKTSHESDAHRWRALLMKTLFINSIDGLKRRDDRNEKPATDYRQYAAHLRQQFFSSNAVRQLLKRLPEESAQRQREYGLQEMIYTALEYSTRLWCHRSNMQVIGLKELQSRVEKMSVEETQAHSSQKLDEPENIPNAQIIAVIQPLIRVYGTEDGRSYSDVYRVWQKATVWAGGVSGG